MNVGILQISKGECISDSKVSDLNKISYELGKCGYFVEYSLSISDTEKISESFDFLRGRTNAVLVCGDADSFYDAVNSKYELNNKLSTFLLGDTPCAVCGECTDGFITETLIPMLNTRSKTFYATNVFRTIGKTEQQLKIALKDFIKNRNKISVKIFSEPPECTVLVRYSNKTQKDTVREFLAGITDILKDCTYSYRDIDISEKTAEMLMKNNKTLGLAESFTGGNIAASLVKFAGISKSLKESIVCYDNSVKHERLRVSQNILDNYGAVSIETAYEMAANLLMDGKYDYVIATTGNAGPTSEKPNETGVCYIAVGDKNNIDIYPYKFDGDRQEVIQSGVKTALYHLYKRLGEDMIKSDITENNG